MVKIDGVLVRTCVISEECGEMLAWKEKWEYFENW
jgi:hypothetical protein